MEGRFGQDFGSVRLHTDERAARSAASLEARAYTLGSDVYFGRNSYDPATPTGRGLMAHELTHVVQQRGAVASTVDVSSPNEPAEGEADAVAHEIERSTAQPSGAAQQLTRRPLHRLSRRTIQRQTVHMASGRQVGQSPAADDNLREEVLLAIDRLHALWSISNPDYSVEYPTVIALALGAHVPPATIPKTIAAITQNQIATMNPQVALFALDLVISGNVGTGQANAKTDILWLQDYLHTAWFLSNPDYATERAAVNGSAAPSVPDALIPQTIAGISRLKDAIVAGKFAPHVLRRELSAGTHAVTPAEHAAVEATLTPGATVVTPPPVVGVPPPPPVVVPPPLMSGAGVGGPFETAMRTALTAYVGGIAAAFRTLRASPGQPKLPIAAATGIATVAQREVEGHFAPYIQVASRGPADVYHPGAYTLASDIGDQSSVPVTDAGTVDHPGRIGWVGYWMKQAGGGQAVMSTYHCNPTRAPDDSEFNRVRDAFATDPANRTDIDDAIHSYPAETSFKVYVQPYQYMATPLQARQRRWDLFTTLLHEMMHRLEHPNHVRARDLIGGDAMEILKEGMADVMRHDLWDPPGDLKTRLSTPAMATLRTQVEGAAFPYLAAAISYHPDYTAQYPAARQIVFGGGPRPGVGIENAKVAYFMGHVELLGIGAGTATTGGASLAGVGMYQASESADAEIVVAGPGDSESTVRTRTNAAAGGVLDAGSGTPLAAGVAVAAGTRLRVPGIRWTYALQEDTLGSIANQHAIALDELARANSLPALTPETYKFLAGTRVLIPIHLVRP